jgi:glycosyltransferase involved in cell wall biosynthesis
VTAVGILSPGFAAARGGVTDHTARLLSHWQARGVAPAVLESPHALARFSGALLVQYVPFLYGRRGLSRDLERAVQTAHAARTRITIFVHEPWVPPTRLPWLILSPLQRGQLRRLVRHADAVVTPVPAWQALLPVPSEVVYVGSTLGPQPPEPPPPLLDAPVVFSPFAAGLSWSWILAAEAAVQATPGLVIVGATYAEARDRLDLPAHARRWEWLGRLPSTEALRALARARLVLAPYVDGLTGRRTAALAALSTGTAVVSSHGPLSDPVFDDGPVGLAETADEFARFAVERWSTPEERTARAERQIWFDRHFDAGRLDHRLLSIVLGPAA